MLQLALDSVNCLNYFCRPLSGVYFCKFWRFPLYMYMQALASFFLQEWLNVWFRLICDQRKNDKHFFPDQNVDTKMNPVYPVDKFIYT